MERDNFEVKFNEKFKTVTSCTTNFTVHDKVTIYDQIIMV